MIAQILSLLGEMYAGIGPGFFFALALPLLLGALALVLRALVGHRRGAAGS